MANLVLVRGLPGSGKSTFAKQNYPSYNHYEADMYFVKDGVYTYNPEKIRDAHEWCQAKTLISLRRDESVVVSNTFTRLWEMTPYLMMIDKFGDNCEVFTMRGNYQNIHGVPDSVLEQMKARWEE